MATEIRFTLSEQDCVDAARDQYRHRVTSWRQWRWPLFILTAVSIVFAYLDSCDLESALYGLIPYVGLMLIVFPLLAVAGYFFAGKHARRMFRQQVIHPESRMSWTDDGLQNQNEIGSFAAQWSDFYGWRNLRAGYMFLINEGIYYFIPRHVISAAQAKDLEETIARSGLAKV